MTKTFVTLLPPYENENENKNMDILDKWVYWVWVWFYPKPFISYGFSFFKTIST